MRPGMGSMPALVRIDGDGNIAQDLLCRCGASLRGLAVSGSCPACRTAIDAVPMIELDADGHIATDVHCRQCAYDLRGLPPRGRCPECETAIERSVLGDALRFSEPAWVDRLARGVHWLIVAVFTVIASVILVMIGGMLLGVIFAGNSAGGATEPGIAVLVGGIIVFVSIQIVAAAMFVFGVWLLTSPDPGAPPGSRDTIRLIARYGMMVQLVVAPFGAVSAMGSGWLAGTGGWMAWVSLAMLICVFVPLVAMFAHARRLARRIPDQRLVRQGTIVLWGTVCAKGLEVVMLAVSIVVTPMLSSAIFGAGAGAQPPSGAVVASSLQRGGGCVTAVVGWVFGIWTIVLMFMFRDALRRAAASARSSWAIDAPQPVD